MAISYSNLQLKAASEAASIAVKSVTPMVSMFAHNFKPINAVQYAGVAVPVIDLSAAQFAEGTNDWGNGSQLSGEVITLDYHPKAGIKLTDVEYGETNINYLVDGAQAISYSIGKAISQKTIEALSAAASQMLTADNITTADVDLRKYIANALKKGLDPQRAVVIVDPVEYAFILNYLDASKYGGREAFKDGYVPGLMGFKAVACAANLSATAFIVDENAVGVASRINQPVVNGYANTWTAEVDDGISMGFRIYEDLAKGALLMGGDALFGVKVLNPKNCIKMTVNHL